VTIDTLPDVALLEIFDFYIYKGRKEAWYTLVHVCRQWRKVVFGSPRRLNLRLYCRAGTPVRETLDVWPPLPIVVMVYGDEMWDEDDIVAVLERNDRICGIDLWPGYIPNSRLERLFAAMLQPLPALTRLQLHCEARDETAPAFPNSFLGGSAPRLQSLILGGMSCPGLPKLIQTAIHLVTLELSHIPHSGYFPPEAMVTGLSVLTRLEKLVIGFDSPQCCPDRRSRRPPLSTRSLLPALTTFQFKGVGEYLEDLVARIDAPLLDDLEITFLHQLIFDTPQLAQFISRTPRFNVYDGARVVFSELEVRITLSQTNNETLKLGFLSNRSEWQLSSLAQVSSFFPQDLLHTVEHLRILENEYWRPDWQKDIESSLWLELLHPFIAVKDLRMSEGIVPRVTPTLRELVAGEGEGVIEVLPALQSVLLEEPLPSGTVQETIGQFVTARQLAGHPITVSHGRS
jgi:F-box-like